MKDQLISDSLGEVLVGYYTNQMNQSQAEELLAWISENEDNMHYFHEIGNLWYASSLLSKKEKETVNAWKKLLDKIEDNDIRPMPKPYIRIRKSIIYWLVAAVLFTAIIGTGTVFVFRQSQTKSDSAYFEALAPKGSRSFITLSDGSTVWLNSGTRLRYQRNFGLEGRELYLEGEAYFEVAENKSIPFRVKTSDVCITALGTAFNVKAYNDENTIETTLEKGEVQIEVLNTSKQKPASATVFLKPNQKAVYVRSSKNLSLNRQQQKAQVSRNIPDNKIKNVHLKVDSLVDTKLTTSWKDSRWIFKSEKLLKLAPILERRYDITIAFRDSLLRSYKFTGTLKEESLEQVLNAICLASPIRYEINHNHVIFFEDLSQKNRYYKPLKTN